MRQALAAAVAALGLAASACDIPPTTIGLGKIDATPSSQELKDALQLMLRGRSALFTTTTSVNCVAFLGVAQDGAEQCTVRHKAGAAAAGATVRGSCTLYAFSRFLNTGSTISVTCDSELDGGNCVPGSSDLISTTIEADLTGEARSASLNGKVYKDVDEAGTSLTLFDGLDYCNGTFALAQP